jgi:hypothetical protein
VAVELDPFTKVYDALWDLAVRNKALTDLIKVNNRIQYDKWIGAKDDISTADLPELALIVDGGLWNFQATSSHSSFERQYDWAITTGDFTIRDYNRIVWELCRAMTDWDRFICPVSWNGAQVVKNANQGELTEGTLRVEQNRNIRGWASIWTLNVEFMIPTTLMRIPDTP